ncbi:proline iminopeptidase-family hydrolase [Lactobacillus sp. ESL0791]|uniref:proline iminopeptidase-family hydrolase n=1 Tax=Lactobacillus sp. ESL0791 TaxID=2983234 RepID=UPI0023F681B9|nr:proline iminopeptidase-family hydrolase [Lactobacillus sp. ESL0791]MDF7639749.1 proline iminopeptidase-family hydrolase [Lactobacillus sp. ESL0791]
MTTGSKILTLDNGFHLFTRTVGEGDIKLLCVHGGPGSNHEEFENFGEELANYHVQVSMYDQLGSFYSDQPDFSDPANKKYLTIDYYLSELEEVRQKLGLDNFYLLGHSWGGLLAQEYALKYGSHLKGLIIMSMVDNIPEYITNINRLRDEMFSKFEVDYMKEVEEQERFDDPKYNELVVKLYKVYVMRHPENSGRHTVSTNATPVYNYFQGNNEFVMTGILKDWDRRADTHKITNKTLLTFGDHDTMPLDAAERMHKEIKHSRFVLTPDGGHCHSVDNPQAFFQTLGEFLTDVQTGRF